MWTDVLKSLLHTLTTKLWTQCWFKWIYRDSDIQLISYVQIWKLYTKIVTDLSLWKMKSTMWKRKSHIVWRTRKAQRDHTLLCWKGSRRRGRERVCKDPSARGDHGHHAMVSCSFHHVWLYFIASPRHPLAKAIDR